MASDVRPPEENARQKEKSRTRANPGQLQTKNLNRYSYLETPVEMQPSTFQQPSSPTNSTIDESPISPRDEYTYPDPRTVVNPQMQVQDVPERTGSPYGFPAPKQIHPAYFAPFSEYPDTQRQQQTLSEGIPPSTEDSFRAYKDVKSPGIAQKPQASNDDRKENALSQTFAPAPRQVTQIYAPDSLGGPNGALENHRPGQVAHPNSAINPEWRHGLCEPDATCCLSLFCPCIVYGKTQYRLSRKAQKQDPTDLLGYEAFNGSCGVMAAACGFQCKPRATHDDWGNPADVVIGALAAIQRARIRKIYKINGSFGSDCVKSLCCCCCVIAQDEREVRDRENQIRNNAGPTSGAYVSPGQMAYEPPPR